MPPPVGRHAARAVAYWRTPSVRPEAEGALRSDSGGVGAGEGEMSGLGGDLLLWASAAADTLWREEKSPGPCGPGGIPTLGSSY